MKRLIGVFALGVMVWLAVEFIYSSLSVYGVIYPTSSFWVFEESGKTVQFDPIIGLRYTTIPSRSARITNGQAEYVATFRGNTQGFPDQDDFVPERREAAIRLAVLGDSFTAGEHLPVNWPERVEMLARVDAYPLELLNFSVSGGGLANWWSIVTRHVALQAYELDGLVFAVFEGDLRRSFSFSDHRGYRRHVFARSPSWNPSDWPKTLEEARNLLQELEGFIVDAQTFERAIHGQWNPYLPRPWRLYATLRLQELLQRYTGDAVPARMPPRLPSELPFQKGQLDLIGDIKRFLDERDLPVLIVTIPSREALLAQAPVPADSAEFARLLGGTLVDGTAAFAGMTEAAVRGHWLPQDGHWAEAGSDRFAAWFYRYLIDWLGQQQRQKVSIK